MKELKWTFDGDEAQTFYERFETVLSTFCHETGSIYSFTIPQNITPSFFRCPLLWLYDNHTSFFDENTAIYRLTFGVFLYVNEADEANNTFNANFYKQATNIQKTRNNGGS